MFARGNDALGPEHSVISSHVQIRVRKKLAGKVVAEESNVINLPGTFNPWSALSTFDRACNGAS